MMTIPMLLLIGALQAPPQPAATQYTTEQLAYGAVLEIISAQAVHKKMFPEAGYACSLERLVEAELLLDMWTKGERVDGYTFNLWCEKTSAPQASFRASAVPVKKTEGSELTVCADETTVARTVDGDIEACFEQGTAPKK